MGCRSCQRHERYPAAHGTRHHQRQLGHVEEVAQPFVRHANPRENRVRRLFLDYRVAKHDSDPAFLRTPEFDVNLVRAQYAASVG